MNTETTQLPNGLSNSFPVFAVCIWALQLLPFPSKFIIILSFHSFLCGPDCCSLCLSVSLFPVSSVSKASCQLLCLHPCLVQVPFNKSFLSKCPQTEKMGQKNTMKSFSSLMLSRTLSPLCSVLRSGAAFPLSESCPMPRNFLNN